MNIFGLLVENGRSNKVSFSEHVKQAERNHLRKEIQCDGLLHGMVHRMKVFVDSLAENLADSEKEGKLLVSGSRLNDRAHSARTSR